LKKSHFFPKKGYNVTMNRQIKFNDLARMHKRNFKDFKKAFNMQLEKNDFILGASVIDFELKFANYVKSKYAIGVANGSDAIRLALLARGIAPGDKVALAANTYFAAAAAIVHVGATPVFFDVNTENRFPTTKNFEEIIDSNPRLIIRSHLFGFADIEQLPSELSDVKQLIDCAQAHGTEIDGVPVGGNEMSTFSFYPGKNLGAFGDGGAITMNDEKDLLILKKLRNQGTDLDKYSHEIVGFNSRLDTLQAKILEIKLANLNNQNDERRRIARKYDELLQDLDHRLSIFFPTSNLKSSYHLYQIRVSNIDIEDLILFLKKAGIESGRHYPKPLHLQTAFQSLGYLRGQFPGAEKLAKETISLPMHPNLSDSDVEYVVEQIKKFLKSNE